MHKTIRTLFCTLLLAAAFTPAHAVLLTIDETISRFASDGGPAISLEGVVDAEPVDTALGSFFRFEGGSEIRIADTSYQQAIQATTIGIDGGFQVGLDGLFNIDFSGFAFDIIQGSVRDGDSAASLRWTSADRAAVSGTLNTLVTSPIGGVRTSFDFTGWLMPEETVFNPSSGTAHVAEGSLGLSFDVVFALSIDVLTGGAGLDAGIGE